MDNLTSILRNPAGVNNDVKVKALALIQNWSQIAEAKPQQMGYISETYKSLCSSGFEFPPMDSKNVVSAALVETMTAPEWTDSDVCMRCRTAFGTFNRKHHCRNCGNVFDQDCSSKTMALPWFGVGQDVRVCDGCFAKRAPTSKAVSLARSKSAAQLPSGRGGAGSSSSSSGTGWHQRSRTMGPSSKRGASKLTKEDDDLALAIKLSLEASSSSGSRPGFVEAAAVKEGRPTKQADGRMLEGTDADDDPDLAAAIAASLRDYAAPTPSAPDGLDDGRATPRPGQYTQQTDPRLPLPPSLELPASDVDALLSFSHSTSTQEAYARQHGQWQPPHQQYQTQELYEKATAARPRMARSLDEATRRHGVLVSMHDKLSEAVRLYDRLLDAQMARPTMYNNAPYYNSAPYSAQQLAYQEAPQTMYPSLPMQGGYEQEQHHAMASPELAYNDSYAHQQHNQYYSARPSYAMTQSSSSSREDPIQHSYSRHGPPLQQVASNAPSAPPPAPSSVNSASAIQNIGSPNIQNRWQTLESLPSAPVNTVSHTGSNTWSLSPPSQLPANGSLYGNMPSLPQFEALPAHEQQLQPQIMPANGPPLQSIQDNSGWLDADIKKSTRLADEDGSLIDSPHKISSPYSAPPWTRPVETPLIDL